MKNKQKHELAVCGIAAVQALALQNPQKIKRFYYTRERACAFGFLCKDLALRRIPYNQVEHPQELEKLCASVHHQGVTAMIEMPVFLPVSPTDVSKWASGDETILILDNLKNAQNVGAIIRSAAFFGIKNLVLPAENATSLITTSAYRNAQGGMEFVNLYAVRSLPLLLQDMKGKMLRVGTAGEASLCIRDIGAKRRKTTKGCAVILGNEETGISPEIKKMCDYLVSIPAQNKTLRGAAVSGNSTKGANLFEAVPDSLNVAQAAAVILYEMSYSVRP